MLRNYIRVAFRNLRSNPGYSVLNLAGLSVGLGFCLLIAVFVRFHLDFDRHVPEADRIYRVASEISINENRVRSGVMQGPLAGTLAEEIPTVREAFRLKTMGKTLVESGENTFYETGIMHADPAFLDIFGVRFLQGDPSTALSRPDDIVLTESAARTYFGQRDPVGETLIFDNTDNYTVSGVVADPPRQSHLRYSMLVNLPATLYGVDISEWNRMSAFYTYLLLEPGASPGEVTALIPQVLEGKVSEKALEDTRFYLQALPDIHLRSDLNYELVADKIFDIRYIYLFTAIGALILLIAGINYVNLATVRAAGRLKEIGIRKAAGARREQLFWQFISESMLLVTGGALVAVALAEYALPVLGGLLQQDLGSVQVWSPAFAISFWGSVLLAGLAAGLYPAWYLSGFRPTSIFKADSGQVLSGEKLRKGLVLFQFTVSLALIISTVVVYKQLNYFQSRNLGLNPDQVLAIPLESTGAQELGSAFAERLRGHGTIGGVTESVDLPARGGMTLYLYPNGSEGDVLPVRYSQVDTRFLDVMQMELVAGRNLRASDADADEPPALINETAARRMGWSPGEAPGKKLDRFRIVGVVRDFHTASFHEEISPVVMVPIGGHNPSYIAARLPAGSVMETMEWIRGQWSELAPGYPFEYSFLDESFEALYRSESRMGYIFAGFSLVAVVIACLGLFGLVSFICTKRSREIGIRKVLGANTGNIIALLTRDYAKIVALGFLIAVPIAWQLMNSWLEEFAYRIEIGAGVFLLSGLAALLIVLVTVSWQSVRAALANPVESLKQE